MRSITINENDANQRLDKFMTKFFSSMPQSLIYKYIRKNCVKVNRKKMKPDYKLVNGDVVDFYINEEFFEKTTPENAFLKVKPNLDVVYEDENILLVNKPVGMVVHEDETESVNTLIAHVQSYLYNKGEYKPENENSFAPALCNRIDRNTQGIVIAAKNANTLRIINQKIKDKEIRKFYLCLVGGHLKKKQDTLSDYLRKDENLKMVFVSKDKKKDAKQIITKYKVLKELENSSLVEVELITGRTHQIRAHFAYIGHPLLGDGKYGENKTNKEIGRKYQALCSYKVMFEFNTDAGDLEYLKGRIFEIKDVNL